MKIKIGILAAALVTAPSLMADEQRETAPDRPARELSTVTVIGSKEAVARMPGSAAFLDREDIERQGYDDAHRMLREIPGVNVREEDGYGLFPNISIRGADPGRSSKVTIMEDGVMMAPAPYAAPAAYYSPAVGRMSGIEVIKGSSQVQFGPHTTGGVINYLSTPIPQAREGYIRSAFGSDTEFRNQLWLGDRVDTGIGRFGYVVELFHRQTEGFKDITGPLSDVGPDAGDSGFRRIEPMIKLAWQPNTTLRQQVDLTYGRSEMDADETYLGISTADFRRNATQRYAASQFDNIRTRQERAILRYSVAPTDNIDIVGTAYRTDFERNWDKIRAVGDGSTTIGLGRALAEGGAHLEVLRGERAGTWDYRDNNRVYYTQGIDLKGALRFDTGAIGHELRAGVRYHEDEATRFQRNTRFNVNDEGVVVSRDMNAPGSQDDRDEQAEALAFYVENAVSIGNLTVTPGVRVERIDWTILDRRSGTEQRRSGDGTFTTGGVGVNYALTQWTLFGGLYRGFSPPSPGDGIAGEDEEKSLSLELGARHRTQAGLLQELVVFGTDFDNLLVPNNAGAAGTADGTESVGEVEVLGVEYGLRYDHGRARGWALGTPVAFSATYTRARIANDSATAGTGGGDGAESIFSGGFDGARLPYIPDFQLSLSGGVHGARWSLDGRFLFVDSAFATALNSRDEVILAGVDPDTGERQFIADARGGKVDTQVVFDVTGRYRVTPAFTVFASAFNLLDREYIASRLPEGPRPGAPRTLLVGIEAQLF